MVRADLGRELTDQRLAELEKRISKEYEQAEKELKGKLDEHFRLFKVKDATKLRQLREGKITVNEYKKWRVGQMAVGERWEAMRKNIADDLVNRTKIAKSIANGYMADIYALNMNYATYEIEKGLKVDTSFTLYSREAVERIIEEQPKLLPPPGKQMQKKLLTKQAVKWEEGQIQSVITQAILQGESIGRIASRMARDLCVKERKAAIRYARTATTEAENAGRLDSYRRAEGMGIKMKKTWLATLDRRTRDAHRSLDGQTIPVDEPFENRLGQIMYPGDPDATAGNIWNCRCSMVSQMEGFERDVEDLSLRRNNKLEGMSYDSWKKAHGESQDITMPDKIAKLMRKRYIADYRR